MPVPRLLRAERLARIEFRGNPLAHSFRRSLHRRFAEPHARRLGEQITPFVECVGHPAGEGRQLFHGRRQVALAQPDALR